MSESKKTIRAQAIPGVSHTEGLCGQVINRIDKWNKGILASLSKGSFPSERTQLGIDVLWHGATDKQSLITVVDVALRPLNTGGYYWVLIVRIDEDKQVELSKGVFTHTCCLLNRHLIIAPSGDKLQAWLLPEHFDLHNSLVRDMIFCQGEDDHRLIFAHLHTLTSVFWRI